MAAPQIYRFAFAKSVLSIARSLEWLHIRGCDLPYRAISIIRTERTSLYGRRNTQKTMIRLWVEPGRAYGYIPRYPAESIGHLFPIDKITTRAPQETLINEINGTE